MHLFIVICFILCTNPLFANVSQKLKNGHLAYYGQQFYANPSSISKDSLHDILNESHISSPEKYDEFTAECLGGTCYFHQPLGYDEARKTLFGKVYTLTDSNGTYVKDVYCGKNFYFRTVDEAMRMNTEVNTEHTWPQSKFSRSFSKSIQVSDMHHLFLTDSMANARRGNHEFGEVSEQEDELNMDDCTGSRLGHKRDLVFYPPTPHRGNVARAIFYFAIRYKMTINKDQETTLRQWHKMDPVDDNERARHEIIANHQKVRNPFVDYPELVERIADF